MPVDDGLGMDPKLGLGRDPRVEFKLEPGLTSPLGLVMLEGLLRELGLTILGFKGSGLALTGGKVTLGLGLGGFSLVTPAICGFDLACGVLGGIAFVDVSDSVELEFVRPDPSPWDLVVEVGLLATLNPVFFGVNFKLFDADAKRGFLRAGVTEDGRPPDLPGVAETIFLFTGLNGSFLRTFVFLVTDPGCFKLSVCFCPRFFLVLVKRGFLAVGLVLEGGSIFSLEECFSTFITVDFFFISLFSFTERPSDSSIELNLFCTDSSSSGVDTIPMSSFLGSIVSLSSRASPKLGDMH